jgi:two-component system phosphate regulon response regulator OmpR
LNPKPTGSLAEKVAGLPPAHSKILGAGEAVKNILLVEDDEGTAEYLRDCLQRAGYGVAVAARGAAALISLGETVKPSVVLLDCTLPDADGLKLCKSIKSVPVIILTGLAENRARLRAQEAGARLFLNKPVSSEDLLKAVSQVLEQVDMEKRQAVSSALALVVNESARTILYGKKTTKLAGRPLRLLLLLAGKHPAPVERRRLAERLNPDDRDREVDVLVSLIRRKCRRELGVNPIETVAGIGYRLILPVQLS